MTPCKLYSWSHPYISCNPVGHAFFSRLFPGEWEPCGGATSRVSRYASARKSQDRLLPQSLCLRTFVFSFCFSSSFVRLSLQSQANSFARAFCRNKMLKTLGFATKKKRKSNLKKYPYISWPCFTRHRHNQLWKKRV